VTVGEHGIALEAGLGAGIPRLARATVGQGALGVYLGKRWYLQRAACRTDEAVQSGGLVVIGVNERGEKRFLAIEDGVREVDPELAGSPAEIEATRPEGTPELAMARWDAAHDVQVGTVCREEVETVTWVRLPGQGDYRREVQR